MKKATLTVTKGQHLYQRKVTQSMSVRTLAYGHTECALYSARRIVNCTTGPCQEGPLGTIRIDGNVSDAPGVVQCTAVHIGSIRTSTDRKFVLCWQDWKRKAAVLFLIKSYLRLDGTDTNSTCLNPPSFSRSFLSSGATFRKFLAILENASLQATLNLFFELYWRV